jgi:hypothetical protein
LIFEETVAMGTQDLELKKWKIHEQPSVHCNVLHCWYEYEIRYIISFQFQVKSASEEDALLKLCVIVCTILKKNMQVGCHVSVVLKAKANFHIFLRGCKKFRGGGGEWWWSCAGADPGFLMTDLLGSPN